MEGQVREVRGEGKDGGGGDKQNKSPTTGMTNLAIFTVAPPAIIEVTINQQWWQPVEAREHGGQ